MHETRHVLHVLNYAWPCIDGYTVRSMGLITAQQAQLGLQTSVAVSPFPPLASATDEGFTTPAWGPAAQIHATRYIRENAQTLKPLERPTLGLAPWAARLFARELDSIIRRLEPDLIHVHHPHYVGKIALAAARRFDLPAVYELRCFNGDYDLGRANAYCRLRGRYQNRLEHQVCRAATTVVTISDSLAERIAAGGIAPERIHVIRNSVDTDLFTPAATGHESSTRPRQIGYACTFSAMEGLDMLVRAVARNREALAGRLRVTIAGSGADWPRIRRLVDELGVADIVELPGFIAYSEMPDFYRRLDLLVVPRLRAPVSAATTPLKPLEALASGVPILASDLPALRELLKDRQDVVFFSPDERALADALTAYVRRPWPHSGEVPLERSWRSEIVRYSQVYAAAQARHANDGQGKTGIRSRLKETARDHSKRILRHAADRGWPGLRPLDYHLVLCGFPRTGSTLLQLMIACCVADVKTFPGEVDALWAAPFAPRRHRYMLTKLPRDIAYLDAVRAYYRQHPGRAHFGLMIRDPRAVLTSQHKAYPGSRGYYVDIERWRTVYEAIQHHRRDTDVTLIHYEELVRDPDAVEACLTAALGWRVRHPFSSFQSTRVARRQVRDSMTEGALGGLRPVEASRVAEWKKPEHRARLHEILAALPELPEYLIALGYEHDRSWLDAIDE